MAVNFGSAVSIRALVLGGRGGIGGAFVRVTENFNDNTLSNFLASRYILGDKDLVHISTDTGDSAGHIYIG